MDVGAGYIAGTLRKLFFVEVPENAVLPGWLAEKASELGVGFAAVYGIGGMSYAKVAVFDATRKTYRYVEVKPLDENHVLEVVGLMGNLVAGPEGRIYPHLHVILARKPGEVYAGHLVEARVKPFLELFVLEAPAAERAASMLSHRWATSFGFEPLH